MADNLEDTTKSDSVEKFLQKCRECDNKGKEYIDVDSNKHYHIGPFVREPFIEDTNLKIFITCKYCSRAYVGHANDAYELKQAEGSGKFPSMASEVQI